MPNLIPSMEKQLLCATFLEAVIRFYENPENNFEHMACGIVADWSETGMTEIRICDLEELKKCEIFR